MDGRSNNKPFIVYPSKKQTLLPDNYIKFSETMESYVRFVQAANSFIIVFLSFVIKIFLLYESAKQLYLHFAFQNVCSDYANMLLAVMIDNLIWVMVAVFS